MSKSPSFSTGCLSWFRCSPADAIPIASCTSPPLVALMTWMWAKPGAVLKFVNLYRDMGFDVAVYRTPAVSVWSPSLATSAARQILRELQAELQASGARPLVFATFSGAPKAVYYKLLPLVQSHSQGSGGPAARSSSGGAAPPSTLTDDLSHGPTKEEFPLVSRCFAGQIFDSGPVDFTSEAGVHLLAPPPEMSKQPGSGTSINWMLSHMKHQAGMFAAGFLDFFLLEMFNAQRAEMWHVLQTCGAQTEAPAAASTGGDAAAAPPKQAVSLPTSNASDAVLSTSTPACTVRMPPGLPKPPPPPSLFLFSWNDSLADAAKIHALAGSMREAGAQVIEQSWAEGGHLHHYKNHPEAYRSVTQFFLRDVVLPEAVRRLGRGPAQCSQPASPVIVQHRFQASSQAKVPASLTGSSCNAESQAIQLQAKPHSGMVGAPMADSGPSKSTSVVLDSCTASPPSTATSSLHFTGARSSSPSQIQPHASTNQHTPGTQLFMSKL